MLEGFGQIGVRRFGARDALALAGLLVLALALVGSSLPTREFWHRDEARFATIARTMHERGDLLVPHLGSELYKDKPPMLFWLMNLSAWALGGFSDVAARLPSLLASVLTVLGAYLVGSLFFDRRAALLAGVVLVTSVLYMMTSQFALTDPLLICFQTWALYCFIRGEYSPGRGRGRGWYLMFYVLAALATLTKGPIGLLVPGAVLGVWVVLRRGFRDLGRVGLHWGLPVYLVIVAAWLLPAGLQAGWPYVKHLLMNQTLLRATGSGYSRRPWYAYLWSFFPMFWPWAFFVPEALVRIARRWWNDRKEPEQARVRQGLLLVAVWFAVVLAGWSVAGVKRTRYVLFAYPAAALAVGWLWEALLSKRERWVWTTSLATILCIATVLVGALATALAAVPWLDEWVIEHVPGKSSVPAVDRAAALAEWRVSFGVLAGSLLVVAVGLAWLLRRGRRSNGSVHTGVRTNAGWVGPWVALVSVVLQVHGAIWLMPMMNHYCSMRPVAEIYQELRSQNPKATIATHHLFWTAIAWYAQTTEIARADAPDQVLALLESEQSAFVLVEASRLERLKAHDQRFGHYPADQRKAGVRRIAILANQPRPDVTTATEGAAPNTSDRTGSPE